MQKHVLVLVGLLGSVTMTGLASAQEAELTPGMSPPRAAIAPPTSEPAESPGHATGLMIQARVQAQTSLLSIGGTGFLVGYQGPSFALGLGLGLTRLGLSSSGNSGNVMLFQVAPTAIIDVWHSRDGRARANILGSVGYARASLSATTHNQDCVPSAAGGDTCTSSAKDGTASASLIPASLGFGGDYYLSRNFALGAEFGVQTLFLVGVNTASGGASASIDAGGDLEMAYGALRATFVLGE